MSEAVERSLKVSHDSRFIAQDLQRKEAEASALKGENQKLHEEVQSLREKVKSLHVAKLSSDRKVAETLTANCRLEVTWKGREGKGKKGMTIAHYSLT
jgi:peptidoglycan hydrolase CwlO-like protein